MKLYHGITALQHLIDPRTNGIAERAVRRVREGTSAVLRQSGLNERWWTGFCGMLVRDLLADENAIRKTIRRTTQRANDFLLEHWKRSGEKLINFGKKSITRNLSGL